MEFEIESEIFWKNTEDLFFQYRSRTFQDKEVIDFNKKFLGLKFKDSYFIEGGNYKLKFKIVDKEKFLWFRLKYGI